MAKNYTAVATFPSSSKSGKVYTVKVDEQGKLSCDCPVWAFNQKGDRTCYHTLAYIARCSGTQLGTRPIISHTKVDDGLVPSNITGEPKRRVRLEKG